MQVLILILLDHALRVFVTSINGRLLEVLILILLDHALRDGIWNLIRLQKCNVLILILLDHALRGNHAIIMEFETSCLNPYSIGPCSPRNYSALQPIEVLVLILILLDHALRACGDHAIIFMFDTVLILILLDHALRV